MLSDLFWLATSAVIILFAAFIPLFAALRVLGASRSLSLALAPAVSAAVAALGAILTEALHVRWGLLPYLLLCGAVLGATFVVRRWGTKLPTDKADAAPLLRSVPGAVWWLLLGAASAIVPVALAFGRPDGVLERWDTLYHLNQLARIRETGEASSLTFGQIATSSADPAFYPAAFHALASLVPWAPIPVLLNAATAALAIVPWTVGCAVLARVLWPEARWGAFITALVALIAPAAPLNEWIHLSAIPNLTGVAMLPGVIAAAAAWWRDGALIIPTEPGAHRLDRHALAPLLVLGTAGIGLVLMQPNVAVSALIVLAVMTAVSAWQRPGLSTRERAIMAVVPILLLIPLAVLVWTPLGSAVTEFNGGLQVSFLQGIGEVGLGLLTVWPMPLGVALAALWWPGVLRALNQPSRWIAAGWMVFALLYVDAAIDSPLGLSVLYYRGQDRLSLPFTMLTTMLVIPGIQAWGTVFARRFGQAVVFRRPVGVGLLVLLLGIGSLVSVPSRLEKAELNARLDFPSRGRFLQEDELAAFDEHADELRDGEVILASPFSGAAHMYAIHGLRVRFPVAGMNLSSTDRNLLQSVPLASRSPAHCANLANEGIGYVYQERLPYQFAGAFSPLNRDLSGLGPVVFETSHSRLIKVDCDGPT